MYRTGAICALLLSLCASGGPAAEPDWNRFPWRGGLSVAGIGGGAWGRFPEAWWYGLASGFAVNAEVDVHCRNCTEFTLAGEATDPAAGDAWFGVELLWNAPLTAGTAYRFVLSFLDDRQLPDLATVNDEIVWRRADGFAEKQEIHLHYVSGEAQGKPRLRLFYRAGADPRTVDLRAPWSARTHVRSETPFAGAGPANELFPLPDTATHIAEDPARRARLLHETYCPAVAYSRPPLPELDRPTADLVVCQRCIGPATGGAFLRMADVQTLMFQPIPWQNETVFSRWADAAAQAGIRNLILPPVLDVRATYDPEWEEGGYRFYHLHSLMNKGAGMVWKYRPDWGPEGNLRMLHTAADQEAALMKEWLRQSPAADLYHFNVEMNGAFGDYGGGIRGTPLRGVAGYEEIREMSRREAFETVFGVFRDYRQRLEAGLGEDVARRLKVMANFDRAGFQGAYAAMSGVDIIIHKCIHRQSLNVVVANSRGTARAYGIEYGYDFDQWDRNYWYGYPPESVRHGLMLLFHTGARYLMNEIPVFDEKAGQLTGWGPMWFDFLRYAKLHPRRGEGQARIAVMRGFGDEWNLVGGPSAGGDSRRCLPMGEMLRSLQDPAPVPSKWAKVAQLPDRPPDAAGGKLWQWLGNVPDDAVYLHDFALLNLVFANFGTEHQTAMNRLCTGTPYGPVDFIPWDTPPAILSGYDAVLYLGRGDGTALAEIANLEDYVRHGGRLVIAAGQLRDLADRVAVDQFCGVRLEGDAHTATGALYTKLQAVEPSTVLGRLPNGDPEAVTVRFGQGTCWLFSGEWLRYWPGDLPAEACRGALGGAEWLTFAPASEWLEYQVRRKPGCWMLPVLNHGRGFYPSGDGPDHGPWTGRITVDLRKLGLAGQPVEAWLVTYVADRQPDPFGLEPIPLTVSPDGQHATADLTVDELAELVLGPSGQARAAFFR